MTREAIEYFKYYRKIDFRFTNAVTESLNKVSRMNPREINNAIPTDDINQ